MAGVLRRASPDDDCDVLIETAGNRVRVQLIPNAQLGKDDEPLILDAGGAGFATDGDVVVATGSVRPDPGGKGELFEAWSLRIESTPQEPKEG